MANFYEQNFKVLNEKFPYIANNINDTDCDLTNAETNIKLGCKYFAKMLNIRPAYFL